MKKIFVLFIIISSLNSYAQFKYPFQNPNLTIDERVDDLISRMTVDEKIGQLMDNAPAIDRLGIPEYAWWNECLHGVARAGYATVFPQSITIAASWDKNLIFKVASVISDEARAKHQEYLRRGEHGMYQGLTFWSPNVNIFRDPRWGRGHETYGEDPYLTGKLGIEFVQGLQGGDEKYLKVIATAKHYAVHSGPEKLRHKFNAVITERDLQETYLPAFRALVKEGQVYSVMGAYNRFRGEACCANPTLFDILRKQWNFKGYFVSDCGAIADIFQDHKMASDASSAAALALKSGCDLNCGRTYETLKEALKKGLITEDQIDISVKRLFTARFKLGMFDPVEMVDYAQIPYSVNNCTAHDKLAKQAALESIVLLKNESETLPLSKNLKTIAVIGPNADDEQSLWGNYNGIPSNPVTVLKGIKNKLEPKVNVLYAQGADLADGIPQMSAIPSIYFETEEGKQGLKGEYYNNDNWERKPLYTQTDANINFVWDIDTPDPRLKPGKYSIRWSGYLIAPKTGTYYISDWAKPYMTVKIENGKEFGGKNKHHARYRLQKTDLVAGQKYKIEVKYQNFYGDATAVLKWAVPHDNMLQQAIKTAQKADAVILTLGLNERLEGEQMKIEVEGFSEGDRTSLNLPAGQVKLMKAVVNTGKPVVLVLINGSALSVNYASEHVPAILTAGYPGQEGGSAIADVIFGDYNPAGRLPVTYYKSVDQLPPFEDYDMQGRTYRYFNKKPLFPFGFGLSYTTFSYSNFKIPDIVSVNDSVKIAVDVTNTGKTEGDEIVQLYITDEKASTPRPIRQLEGFERIHLKKEETKTVNFILTPRQLSMINKKKLRVIEPGWFTISVGGKQPDGSGETLTGRFKVKGPICYLPE